MPLENAHAWYEHLPAAGLIATVVGIAPFVRDILLGWWKKTSGEKHIAEGAAGRLHVIQGLMIDAVAKLRDHADRDAKDTEEIIHALEKNSDAHQRLNETAQRIEVGIARLLGK